MTARSLDFRGCTLAISPRSPFARRARLALRENGIPYEEKIHDVLKGSPELNAINPLGRVPTAILKSGEVITDSTVILSFLAEAHPGPLWPTSLDARLTTARWSTWALGVIEKTVEFFFNSQRAPVHSDAELLREIRDIYARFFALLEAHLDSGIRYLLDGVPGSANALTQADLDVGTALAYLSFRYSSEWKNRYARCAEYLAMLEARPSFRATAPAAA